MFPISKDKLSFRKIADYWSREIHPPAGKDELLARLEEAWWLGEITCETGLNRLQLLKDMFNNRGIFERIVFVTNDDAEPPTTVELPDCTVEVVEQPDGTVEVELRPRIHVPSNTEVWDEVSCAAAFKALAGLPSQEYYQILSPGIDSIEITRDEFVKWLGVRGFHIPEFWGRCSETPVSLKPAPDKEIEKAIRAEYDHTDASGTKPPNLKELVPPVQGRLKAIGYTASGNKIQEIGGRREYGSRRRKAGKTVKSEERKPSSQLVGLRFRAFSRMRNLEILPVRMCAS